MEAIDMNNISVFNRTTWLYFYCSLGPAPGRPAAQYRKVNPHRRRDEWFGSEL